jgi:transglutaminase-like putative cysteine protease
MRIAIHTKLHYHFERPTDILLQLEAAMIPEQLIEAAHLDITECEHFARVAAQDEIGERIWVRTEGTLELDYTSTVDVQRLVSDVATLPAVPPHQLPGETVQYLLPSRYCPADQFDHFIDAEFHDLEGGARIAAMRDYIGENFTYTLGSSHSGTTALETFVRREGVCRDYAHVLITLARAAAIPARMASVYAPRVDPPDFHAVAEVFLGGAWHLVDPTGMATAGEMAKIGVGRDAADIAFMTAYGFADLKYKDVIVTEF